MICHALAGFGLSFLQDPLSQCPAVTELFHFCLFTQLRGRVRPHRNETVKFADKIQASHLPNHPAETPLFAVFLYPWKQKPLQSEVFEVHGIKIARFSCTSTVFLCIAMQKPLQIAMFLSLPLLKTLRFTVFLSPLSKSTVVCDVFNDMVDKNTALLLARFSTLLRKPVKHRQCTKTPQKPMFLPNKNHENHRSNRPEMTNLPPSIPCCKKQGFGRKKGPPPQVNLYLTVVYAIRMITSSAPSVRADFSGTAAQVFALFTGHNHSSTAFIRVLPNQRERFWMFSLSLPATRQWQQTPDKLQPSRHSSPQRPEFERAKHHKCC